LTGLVRTLKAMPTLLRVGVAETVAYRAEFLVWVLTTTQPLIMMSLMTFITRSRPFANYDASQFVAYYLATLIVRQLTGNWTAWQMMDEVRLGTLAMRLLRPIHPFFAYIAQQAAAIPFRAVIALPLAIILLVTSSGATLPHAGYQIALMPVSVALAWLVSFAVMFALGTLAFFMTQAMGVGNIYFGMFSLFSGYLLPLDLMPRVIAVMADYLPFKSMMFIPLQLITRPQSLESCLHLLATQAAWFVGSWLFAFFAWNRGIKRFESVGT
jgi:ABC-2 type transport system permease protein